MKQRKNKYNYIYVIQGNYGYGWDDLEECSIYYEAHKACVEYELNECNYPHRIIKRRVLND